MRRLAVAATAVAAATGLLAAGFATPALAADEPQTDQLWIGVPYEQSLPIGADGEQGQSRTLDIGLYHDNDNFTVTDGKVTVDVSGLAGIADVTWPENCAPSGTTAVCDVPEVPVIGPDYDEQIQLTVRAAEGAEAGAQGRITYGATATGAISIHPEFGQFTFDPDKSNNTAVLTVNQPFGLGVHHAADQP